MTTNPTQLLIYSSRQQRRGGSHLGWKRVQKVVESTLPPNPECSSPSDHWDGENREVYHKNYIKANFLAFSCSLFFRHHWSLFQTRKMLRLTWRSNCKKPTAEKKREWNSSTKEVMWHRFYENEVISLYLRQTISGSYLKQNNTNLVFQTRTIFLK